MNQPTGRKEQANPYKGGEMNVGSNPFMEALKDLQYLKQMGIDPTAASYSSITSSTATGGVPIRHKVKMYETFVNSNSYEDFANNVRNIFEQEDIPQDMRMKIQKEIPSLGLSKNVKFSADETGGGIKWGYQAPIDRYELMSGEYPSVYYTDGTYKILSPDEFEAESKGWVDQGRPSGKMFREYSPEENAANQDKINKSFKQDRNNVRLILNNLQMM